MGDNSAEKMMVLLCFNENVRSAEDVWRCHNEFIRDAAHAAGLTLTAEEWRIFFAGEETPDGGEGTPISTDEGTQIGASTPPLFWSILAPFQTGFRGHTNCFNPNNYQTPDLAPTLI